MRIGRSVSAELLACVFYGPIAMKNWDPGFHIDGVVRASEHLLTRDS
jgi:hypothetical protein